MRWPMVLLALSAAVAAIGQPRPGALVVAGIGAATAVFDYCHTEP